MTQRTDSELYIVKSQGSSLWSSSGSDKWCWFRLLEGPDQGMSFSIPLYSSEISDDIQSQLHQLSEDDVVEAQLQRESTDDPWIPISMEIQ